MAPSPTGPLHVGGARTALFNWLFARANQGVFVLRIEDTDRLRSTLEFEKNILDSLHWLGLEWDEGPEVEGPYAPYYQMRRLDTYTQAVEKLLASGHAYYCYCAPEELEAEREAARRTKVAYRYSRRCQSLTPEQRRELDAQGRKPVIRFAMPTTGTVSFDDLIRGHIEFNNSELDDLVIVKSDGIPTYNFAAVVDDSTMRITHVIRGEDHISNTPKQINIYRALGESIPLFGHLPMILGPDRSKLSKRHGAASITEYADAGYLPEAMVNYLALLGWSFDDKREIFSKEELAQAFTIERVGKTGAIFNIEKLDWMNGYYLRQLSLDDLYRRSLPFLQRAELVGENVSLEEGNYIRSVLVLLQERLKRLGELPELVDFFFKADLLYDPVLLVPKGLTPAETLAALLQAKERIEAVARFDVAELEHSLRELAEDLGMKTGQLFGALRVAITGRTVAPPLFQTMCALGKDRTLARIDKAVGLLDELVRSAA
ncbi:MAG: glutamate--tRNA ligase [Chloroflexi bacterium]|nr:glutamate--tRNA ligase [Chloroflexota bacterium]